jgi:divalent metal cation (Fe/Co/Zn/Cd) transporter
MSANLENAKPIVEAPTITATISFGICARWVFLVSVDLVDPLAGALVALLILRTGIFILRESSAALMDAVPSRKLAAQTLALINTIGDVKQVEELQAHRFGPHLVMNLTIGIDETLTVKQGDRIATCVEERIYSSIPSVLRVMFTTILQMKNENMSIDEILSEGQKHVSPYQPEYYE